MGTQTILGARPADAFMISAGPGDIYAGGAVAFKAQQDCSLAGVTLLLRSYTDATTQPIAVQLFEDNAGGNASQPGTQIPCSFNILNGNDGSISEFAFNLTAPVSLKGGAIYWILVYGIINNASFAKGWLMYWVSGVTSGSNSIYAGSLGFQSNRFLPSSVVPAFSIGVTV